MGEDAAAAYLKKQKFKILKRNYSAPTGEIDIIAMDRDVLVFVEVKARSHDGFGTPAEAVDSRKQLKIAKTAQYFVMEQKVYAPLMRFDVLEVTDDGINHIKNAFETNLF